MTTIINAATSGGLTMNSDTSGILSLQTNSTTAVTIDASQNVGIGTTSPASKLHVYSSGQLAVVESSGNYATSGSGYVRWKDVNGNAAFVGFGGNANNFDLYNALAGALTFSTNSTERMRIDSSGNLGLGVTPSATRSTWNQLSVGASLNITADKTGAGGANIFHNAYNNGTSYYQNNGYAEYYQMYNGAHVWYNAPSGTAGNAITFTQAMTLDASGRLGIGTTSPNMALHVVVPSGINDIARFRSDNGTCDIIMGAAAANVGLIYAPSGQGLALGTNATERARIDSSGNLLVGTTDASVGNTSGARFTLNGRSLNITTDTGAAASLILNQVGFGGQTVSFKYSNVQKGYIETSSTAVAYVTSSDYRLKENIAPMTGALAKVSALKPCTYTWLEDGSNGQGFIAHELKEVVPECVTGEKDAVDADGNPVYQGIDTSFLVATLTAAIKEQQAIITSLTERITALEGAAQ